MAITVFLSHSSKDKDFVRLLADELQVGGEIECWLDEREIGYGENIVGKIGKGLKAADFVLLVLSPDSVASNWVEEEWSAKYWKQVNEGKIELIPVLYRDCVIPDLLANKSYADLRSNQAEGMRKIRSTLRGFRPAPRPVVHLAQRSPRFVGRAAELAELHAKLKEHGSVTYLAEMSGQGKTTLALEYAHRHQREFESVHWLPCQGRSLAQIAGELEWQLGLNLTGELDALVHELNGICSRKRCLLIFDNVENEIPGALLPGGWSSVLITTWYGNLDFLFPYESVVLPVFTEDQCFELFRRVVGQREVDGHAEAARSLFRKLGYLPIGIEVAARMLSRGVRDTFAGLAAKLPGTIASLLGKAVSVLTPEAKALLAAMAVCAPEGFRLEIAARIAGFDDEASLGALEEIYSLSLANRLDQDTRRYRLHELVREAAGAGETLKKRHAEEVQEQFRGWETDWQQCSEDMADWQVAFAWCLTAEDEDAWRMAGSLAFWGYSLTKRLGRLPEAYEIFQRYEREAVHRDDKDGLQISYGNQALILRDWGRLDEAMALHKKEEAICDELGDRAGLQASYGNQALILKAWGRLDEAMALHKKEEAICDELGDRAGLQRSYGNQAVILKDWGRLDEAMALHRKEEAICDELGDRAGLNVSYGNQALILQDWGRLDEAMALHKKEEAICDELGDRAGLQASYGNQALILKAWGRLDEAMALHKKEEAICDELGDRAGLQRSYGNQAVILKAWGRLDEAMALHKRKEAICDELGDRAGLQRSYGNQALILQAWGRLDEAMALHQKEEAICAELGDRAGLQASYGNQALILKAWGRLDEAMALHRKEEAICDELGDRAGLQASYGNQALILKAWGRLDEAMALHKRQEAICDELGDRAGLQASYGNQALILKAWGRLDEAMALHKKQEAICAELGDRAGLATSYYNWSLIAMDRIGRDVAREKMKQALEIFTQLGMPRETGVVRKTLEAMDERESS